MICRFESNDLQRKVWMHGGQPNLTWHKAPTFSWVTHLGDAFTPELSPAPLTLTGESSQAKQIREI